MERTSKLDQTLLEYFKTSYLPINEGKIFNLDSSTWISENTMDNMDGFANGCQRIFSRSEKKLSKYSIPIGVSLVRKFAFENYEGKESKVFDIDTERWNKQTTIALKSGKTLTIKALSYDKELSFFSKEKKKMKYLGLINDLLNSFYNNNGKAKGPRNNRGVKKKIPDEPVLAKNPAMDYQKGQNLKEPLGQPKKNKKRKIPESTRHQVWNNHFNSNEGECYSCKKSLKQDETWHCGHICSENRGGSLNPFNMRPVCSNCNKKMGTQHMYLWMILEGYGKNLIGNTPSIKIHKHILTEVENAKKNLTSLLEFNKITERENRIFRKILRNSKISYDELFSILDIIDNK